jgi:putative protease
VYLGLKKFSARAYAENFSMGELRGAIEEARARSVKVYAAINSLIKETELPDAWRLTREAALLKPDAFIVQDLGLAGLITENLGVPAHASTLTAVHTQDGLWALRRLGFSRAVLPRELTLSEVLELSAQSPIPTEMFVHGALCFSFSGLCLFSSFFGGRSALRGGCTQPCRRVYANAGGRRPFFSLPDLRAAPLIKVIREGRLAALKIEGRMKGPDYTERVVRAYRILLDAPDSGFEEALTEASALLDEAPERGQGTHLLVPGARPAAAPDTVSGARLGYLELTGPDMGEITLERKVRAGDRARLASAKGEEGVPVKIRDVAAKRKSRGAGDGFGAGEEEGPGAGAKNVSGEKEGINNDGSPPPEAASAPAGALAVLTLKGSGELKSGFLYRTGSSAEEKKYLRGPVCRAIREAEEKYRPPKISPQLPEGAQFRRDRGASSSRRGGAGLWIALDEAQKIREVLDSGPKKIILPLTKDNAHEAQRLMKKNRALPDIVWRVPPLLFSPEREKALRLAESLAGRGQAEFMCGNLGALEALRRISPNLKIYGEGALGFLNRLAAERLFALGLSAAPVSLEADGETFAALMKAGFSKKILLTLTARPAVFTSRVFPPLKKGPLESPRGEKFFGSRDGSAFVLMPEQRVFMGGCLRGPLNSSMAGWVCDLRRERAPGPLARRVKKALSDGSPLRGPQFNFRRGLK